MGIAKRGFCRLFCMLVIPSWSKNWSTRRCPWIGTSTDTTGYGMGEFGATLAKVMDHSRSPHLGSARVDIGEEGVVSMGVMVDGCNEDGEEGVAGERQIRSWRGTELRRALVNRSAAAPSMTISSSESDRVRPG